MSLRDALHALRDAGIRAATVEGRMAVIEYRERMEVERLRRRVPALEARLAWALDRLDRVRADGLPSTGGVWSRRHAVSRAARRDGGGAR